MVGFEGDSIGSNPSSCPGLGRSSTPDTTPVPTPTPNPSPVPCMIKSSNNPVVGDSDVAVSSSTGAGSGASPRARPVPTSVANSANFTDDPRFPIVMEEMTDG